MELAYKIEMLSDWHVGSGLDAGVEVDALVLKDENGIPYIPGKTIKGLLKDALVDMIEVNQCEDTTVQEIFGNMISNQERTSHSGKAFFSDATLDEDQYKEIASNNLGEYLYRNIASTAIGEKGIAKEKSLRVTQVTMPLTLTGYISAIEKADEPTLKKAFQWVRYLGVNRNRGLGRCRFSTI